MIWPHLIPMLPSHSYVEHKIITKFENKIAALSIHRCFSICSKKGFTGIDSAVFTHPTCNILAPPFFNTLSTGDEKLLCQMYLNSSCCSVDRSIPSFTDGTL